MNYSLQGAIVINNRNEYLISVVDRQKANLFAKGSNKNMFEASSSEELFKDPKIENEFNAISQNLFSQGFKESESNYIYTMAYLLDKYGTGLTISMKKKTDTYFKEVKTNKINNLYKPTICP